MIFFCLSLTWHNAISQVDIDSLIEIIPRLDGANRLSALEELSYRISYIDNEKYLKYSRDGLEYALAEGDSSYISTFLIELGYYFKFGGAYQESLNNLFRSVKISKMKGYDNLLARAYTGLGSVYHELSLYDKALEFHSKSLSIKEASGNKNGLGVSYNNIGLIYYKLDDPVRALEYYVKSLNFKLEKGDTAECVINYINMGFVYSELKERNSQNKAIESFNHAIESAIKYGELYRLGYAYNGIAKVYIEKAKYDSARYFLNMSVKESIERKYKKLNSSNYYLFAKISFLEKQYKMAVKYLQRSQSFLQNIKDKNKKKNNYRLYSEIYEEQKILDSAFYYLRKYTELKDSIFNNELANNIANVQIAKIEEMSQRKIADQEATISKGKSLSFFLLSILILSIALIVVVFRNYVTTRKINKQLNANKIEIEAQKEDLEIKNKQLAEAQITIQNQNEGLKNINVDLDKKVIARTIELDKSNHELEKAVKDLDQFIYKTSHDLRGPIATMQGIINLGIIEAADSESKEYFKTLHKVSNNLNNVLYRLIEVHETYQKKPELVLIDPKKEIIETTNKIAKYSEDADITIVTELRASGQLRSDKLLFNLIIENMLRNAMHYKDRGESVIKIKTRYHKNHMVIVFDDNGFGIQSGDENKVFNIFFKGSPRPGGTGLEIYTTKIAVEKLGGVIRLIKPRNNTIFEVQLPVIN